MAEKELIADYADLGVSCGYIGGVHTWGDDRSFKVFTQLQNSDGVRLFITVFSVPHDHKGTWMEKVEFDTLGVRTVLDSWRAKLATGELRKFQ
jgi:hypothetical protein